MNIYRMNKLADYLDTVKEETFNMGSFFSFEKYDRDYEEALEEEINTIVETNEWPCGTWACVAGHAIFLFKPELAGKCDWAENASSILDLSPSEADSLFYNYRLVNAKVAATFLRKMVYEEEIISKRKGEAS